MENKPRYSRLSDIIDLATFMQASPMGVTINEIALRYNVSRRTAERMRDSLTAIFPTVDEIECNDTQKHWGFINYSISHLISFNAKEIGNLEQLSRRTTNTELKEELNKTIEKLKALNHKNKTSIEENIETYMKTEGYAVRQMPKFKIDIKILDTMRIALQQSKMVECTYHNKPRLLEPLGLIYGDKIYLVAREKTKGDEIYNYYLHTISDLKLTDKTFDKADFNLQAYTNQSFGVYHGEILNVKLSFSPEIAQTAKTYNFHPTQKMKEENDGSLTVTFRASGDKEIIWHIFKWGAGCKILAPKFLQDEYKKYLQENINNYN